LIGAYGWLEDVRPRNPGGGTAATRPSAGFVHAPSLAHAATTAVLRSGYVAHEQSGGSSSLAVDLSSERVRRAQWLLEGVRSGQPLGALLGYRFERALHQQRLDVYIAPFRTLAALKGQDELAQATQAAEDARVLDAATAATLDQRTAAATTARADYDLAAATFVATRTYRDGRAAELETIRALDTALATANQRVVDKTNEINAWQANRPTSVRLDTSDLDARGKPIPTVNLVDSAALTAWRNQLQVLQQQRATLVAEAAAAQANKDAKAGVRADLERELPPLNQRVTDLDTAQRAAQTVSQQADAAQAVADQLHRQAAVALGDARSRLMSALNASGKRRVNPCPRTMW
jgi:hypothetical protein